eukprot:CAMPEP_0198329478 /NCGR_PEP_ID=MMETSP1450-20131203/16211_1 /TAXON_ID=753684 ORGANISM="Madagascaria erythrocladiodes, Strain CCMP3234" /NCGR_SAMPLE_ID=MMETSP1450 /ASSEMBLY_ACC=CAM_ASM_001115 /LENGTH=686 /DNA_ID=CAMNT_0044033701 /DNA_START=1 /DNA_END=2063 /DNA_ORIENTATION=+
MERAAEPCVEEDWLEAFRKEALGLRKRPRAQIRLADEVTRLRPKPRTTPSKPRLPAVDVPADWDDAELARSFQRPQAPVLRPTVAEMEDLLGYVKENFRVIEQHGAVRIDPPDGWLGKPRLGVSMSSKFNPVTQPLPQQKSTQKELNGEKADVTVSDIPRFVKVTKSLSLEEFSEHCASFDKKMLAMMFPNKNTAKLSTEDLESAFWYLLHSTRNKRFMVQYGVDTEFGHRGPPPTKPSLGYINMQEESLLSFLSAMPGINRTMHYIGGLFSRFCWHVEDSFMNSISYLHELGEGSKIWYAVPASASKDFENVMKDKVLSTTLYDGNEDPLRYKSILFTPRILAESGVPFCRVEHKPGTFVVTAPRAYHGGFNCGFSVAEAVNLAPAEWVPYGITAADVSAAWGIPSVIPMECIIVQHAVASIRGQSSEKAEAVAPLQAIWQSQQKVAEASHLPVVQAGAMSSEEECLVEQCTPTTYGIFCGPCCGVCLRSCLFYTVVCAECNVEDAIRCVHHVQDLPCPPNSSHRPRIVERFNPKAVQSLLRELSREGAPAEKVATELEEAFSLELGGAARHANGAAPQATEKVEMVDISPEEILEALQNALSSCKHQTYAELFHTVSLALRRKKEAMITPRRAKSLARPSTPPLYQAAEPKNSGITAVLGQQQAETNRDVQSKSMMRVSLTLTN